MLVLAGALGGEASAGGGYHGYRNNRSYGIFFSACEYSHTLADDPIVKPSQPGASHSHDFFGNVSTNAHSTYASLRAGMTVCRRPGDRASYWVPTLIVNGNPVEPFGSFVYYYGAGHRRKRIRAFPPGLRIVAGTSTATSPQSRRVTSWSCTGEDGHHREVPTCANGEHLRLQIRFPECWDGRFIDSPDHKSHMAYKSDRRCPATHRVAVPQLVVNVGYPVGGGPGVSLASGSPYSGHADFFNAWDQDNLRRLVKKCLRRLRRCNRF